MASQNLSAGASSFVPGGGGGVGSGGGGGGLAGTRQHEFEDDMYDEFMAADMDADIEAIEAEMRKDETADAMDGLTALMGGSTVTKSEGASVAAASSTLPSHLASGAAEFWFPECRNCPCCKGYKHGCPCGGLCKCVGGGTYTCTTAPVPVAPAARGNETSKKPPCKFYQSGSCKFGYKCRFSHE